MPTIDNLTPGTLDQTTDLIVGWDAATSKAVKITKSQLSSDLSGTLVQYVATIAALRLEAVTAGKAIQPLGYYAAGDGGGGPVRVGKTGAPGTYVDNGGSIIVPTGGDGSAAWVWEWSGAVPVEWCGAKGDGTDDAGKIQAAIAANLEIQGTPGKTYTIQSGIDLATSGAKFDLNGSTLNADFASGWAVTIGDGVSVLNTLGIYNGHITTARAETALNGVLFSKNARRRVYHERLRVTGFKGVGIQFQELNWSIQSGVAPLIENCGTNLIIDDNANSITITGIGLDGATGYNAKILGAASITFVGGYNQNAGTAGVLIDTSTVGSMQVADSVSFLGSYFENNGASHIVANNGGGLTVYGSRFNCDNMTGDAIDLNGWSGADIRGNYPRNLTTGTTRNFVNLDAASTGISVGRQYVSAATDAAIGGDMSGLVGVDRINVISALPTPGLINRGSVYLYDPGTGTGANRSRPYMVMDTAASTRGIVRLATNPRKMAAAAAGSPYTPNLATTEVFDLTVTAALTINAPTGAYDDGDEITFLLKQNSVGGYAITWNAAYKTNLSNTGNTADTYASVSFRWSAGRSLWIQVAKLEWVA